MLLKSEKTKKRTQLTGGRGRGTFIANPPTSTIFGERDLPLPKEKWLCSRTREARLSISFNESRGDDDENFWAIACESASTIESSHTVDIHISTALRNLR